MLDFEKIYDVGIIGGGPVGLGLAMELGQRGHSVAVVERDQELHKIPKGQNLTQRTMEHFRKWGCEEEIRAARTVPRNYAIGGITSYKNLLSGYWYDFLQRDLVRPFYYTENERLPQYAMEAVQRARAAKLLGVDISFGIGCNGVEQDHTCATALLTDCDGRAKRLNTKFLVGADGARSMVREAVGIQQIKKEHDKRMVLLVFRSKKLQKLLERYPGKQFYCVLDQEFQGYWLFFGRVDLGSTWFFHAPVPLGTTRENFDFKAYLERAVGDEIDVKFDHIGFWELRIALAETYRNGRVFIAGDACHSHPPYGGYGVNTGLEDARNLGWKLSAVLSGWGGKGLLDSYEEERQPIFRTTAEHFIERFILEDRNFLNSHSPEKDGEEAFRYAWNTRNEGSSEVMAFAPNYDGSSIVWGNTNAAPSAVGSHELSARAGHHLPPCRLEDGAHSFEKLGGGFTLFAHDEQRAFAAELAHAASNLNIPFSVVESGNCEAFTDWQASLVLVRPDDFVAWTGTGTGTGTGTNDDPEGIIAKCAGISL